MSRLTAGDSWMYRMGKSACYGGYRWVKPRTKGQIRTRMEKMEGPFGAWRFIEYRSRDQIYDVGFGFSGAYRVLSGCKACRTLSIRVSVPLSFSVPRLKPRERGASSDMFGEAPRIRRFVYKILLSSRRTERPLREPPRVYGTDEPERHISVRKRRPLRRLPSSDVRSNEHLERKSRRSISRICQKNTRVNARVMWVYLSCLWRFLGAASGAVEAKPGVLGEHQSLSRGNDITCKRELNCLIGTYGSEWRPGRIDNSRPDPCPVPMSFVRLPYPFSRPPCGNLRREPGVGAVRVKRV